MSKPAKRKMAIEVVWYTDLIKDENGTWTVNDQRRNTHAVEMPDFTESHIVRFLKQAYDIKETARSNSFKWEWLDDCECILSYKGKPLCEVLWVTEDEPDKAQEAIAKFNRGNRK